MDSFHKGEIDGQFSHNKILKIRINSFIKQWVGANHSKIPSMDKHSKYSTTDQCNIKFCGALHNNEPC